MCPQAELRLAHATVQNVEDAGTQQHTHLQAALKQVTALAAGRLSAEGRFLGSEVRLRMQLGDNARAACPQADDSLQYYAPTDSPFLDIELVQLARLLQAWAHKLTHCSSVQEAS